MAARLLLGIGVSLLLLWAALLVTFAVVRPKGSSLREAVRLLPDTLRLLRSIARDRSLEKSIRVRLWLLFAYMAFPIDLVPDFIPVLGYADDAIIVALVLRGGRTSRRPGCHPAALARFARGLGRSAEARRPSQLKSGCVSGLNQG
jgi:uncharacterized membrane protein YkvA (DUF1232 family)